MEIFVLILIVLAFATFVAATLGFGDILIFTAITALFINIQLAIVLDAENADTTHQKSQNTYRIW